ncbi:hypothetical protein WG954_17910 [Lacibacter sp. H375]|uniref:hypothetical protein n=1 Tax=Lacibacter sp. H375 TaxID=3133424 RepID=UPI0030BA3E1F
MNMRRLTIFTLIFSSIGIYAVAQDTTKKQSVEIVSAFKPVLKNAVKLNFNATPPAPETGAPNLAYNIPVQNLYFNLQPVGLKPMSLQIDSAGQAHNSNYIKVGYGNYNTPLVDAGFTLGDGKKTNFTLFANHLSQRGKLRVQRFSNTSFAANINSIVKNVEVYGKAGYQNQTFFLYGPDPVFANSKEDSLKKPYQTINIRAGVRNAFINRFGISYNPDLNINVFSDTRSTETNGVLDLPVEVRFGNSFGLLVRGNFDLTTFTPTGGETYTNNVFFLNAAAMLKTSRLFIKGGIRPTWDQGKLNVLPDVLVDIHLQEKKIILTGGWTGYVQKNTYQALVAKNPWINQPLSQFNTRITELYGGFKGTLANSFNYRVQTGFLEYMSIPLFSNHIQPGLFQVLREGKLQVLHTQGEIGFVLQDQFNASAKMDIYNFLNQQDEKRPWHFVPIELSAALRWQPSKKIMVKADLLSWQGAVYRKDLSESSERLRGVFDLNAGMEFKVHPLISVWGQFNNIFNNTYQRWNNYQVVGFNLLAGIRLTFDQKQQ